MSTPTSTPARSNTTTPSPTITPMHDPEHRAVVIKQAPLGVANMNQVVPGQMTDASIPRAALGQKALLAKKFAKANKPSLISPTDALQSPCTAKLAGAKQRHFAKGKPASLANSFVAAKNNENRPL
ncbi:hypothetical protein Q5752_005695 [Cryptotrichosporon argae]